jgi:hypothetical protein
LLESRDEIREANVHGLAERHHFNEIKATLATLALADEGLILADALRELVLGKPSPLAFLPEKGKKRLVTG